QIRLIDQRGGLQGDTGADAVPLALCEAAQFVVEQREKLIGERARVRGQVRVPVLAAIHPEIVHAILASATRGMLAPAYQETTAKFATAMLRVPAQTSATNASPQSDAAQPRVGKLTRAACPFYRLRRENETA